MSLLCGIGMCIVFIVMTAIAISERNPAKIVVGALLVVVLAACSLQIATGRGTRRRPKR